MFQSVVTLFGLSVIQIKLFHFSFCFSTLKYNALSVSHRFPIKLDTIFNLRKSVFVFFIYMWSSCNYRWSCSKYGLNLKLTICKIFSKLTCCKWNNADFYSATKFNVGFCFHFVRRFSVYTRVCGCTFSSWNISVN